MATPRRPDQCRLPNPAEKEQLRSDINDLVQECIDNNQDLNNNGHLDIKIEFAIVCPGDDNKFNPGSNDPYESITVPIGRGEGVIGRGKPRWPGKTTDGKIMPSIPSLDPIKDSVVNWYLEYLKKQWDRRTGKPCPNPTVQVGVQCINTFGIGATPIGGPRFTKPILVTPEVIKIIQP